MKRFRTELKWTSIQFRTSLSFVHNASRQHIIGLYGTPADRQAVLQLAWYIRPIRFEIRFERKKNDSQVPN